MKYNKIKKLFYISFFFFSSQKLIENFIIEITHTGNINAKYITMSITVNDFVSTNALYILLFLYLLRHILFVIFMSFKF